MQRDSTRSGPGTVPAGTVLEARVARWPVRIHAERVVEVVARAATSPLPGAPLGVRGVLDHRGSAAVVIDLRERFGADAPIGRWDPFVVVEGSPRWALVVDEVRGVGALGPDARVARGLPSERVAGLALGPDGGALILDPGGLLDEHEIEQLRRALAAREARDGDEPEGEG